MVALAPAVLHLHHHHHLRSDVVAEATLGSVFPPGLGHGPNIQQHDTTECHDTTCCGRHSACRVLAAHRRLREPSMCAPCSMAGGAAPRSLAPVAQHPTTRRQTRSTFSWGRSRARRVGRSARQCGRCPLLPNGRPHVHVDRCEVPCVCTVCNSHQHTEHTCFIAHGVPKQARMAAADVLECLRLHELYCKGEFDWRSTATSLRWLRAVQRRAAAVAAAAAARQTAEVLEALAQDVLADAEHAQACVAAACDPASDEYEWAMGLYSPTMEARAGRARGARRCSGGGCACL
jgi:hypothetical protein